VGCDDDDEDWRALLALDNDPRDPDELTEVELAAIAADFAAYLLGIGANRAARIEIDPETGEVREHRLH
jgi:hypothetical protein